MEETNSEHESPLQSPAVSESATTTPAPSPKKSNLAFLGKNIFKVVILLMVIGCILLSIGVYATSYMFSQMLSPSGLG